MSSLSAKQRIFTVTAELRPAIITPPFETFLGYTFTPKMSKRVAPGPFDRAPIIQGKRDTTGGVDVVTASKGTEISGGFYPNIDENQGSIVFWITPEWSGSDSGDNCILDLHTTDEYWQIWRSSTLLRAGIGQEGGDIFAAGNWLAGTTRCVVVRWDHNNTLDGTNHVCISIDDTHTFGHTSTLAGSPNTDLYIGSKSDGTGPANAIIEGLTIYRRPLYDGTNGIDAGNGDEIAAIYASGSGKDPAQVTGSWDVVFCLPTDQDDEAIVTGTGEAWSHPHNTAELTDTYCQTTYASSAWSDLGTPSTGPADQVAADKIFSWGYKWTCDAANEGVTQGLTGLTVGQNYVLRVIAHTDSADDIRVRIQDDTNTAQIGADFDFGASSDRDTPGVALLCFELPTNARNGAASDCTAISIEVMGTAASQVVYLHQAELQTNLLDNPSLETGSGDPWIPDGWTNLSLDAGDSEAEAATVHSGAGSLQLNTGTTSAEGIYRGVSVDTGKYLSLGIWAYNPDSYRWNYNDQNQGSVHSAASVLPTVMNDNTDAWTFWPNVSREKSGPNISLRCYNASPTRVCFFDDAYAFLLDDVSLTVTPASEANSADSNAGGGISGLRVDGRDTATITATKLTATSGQLLFKWVPKNTDQHESLGEDTNPHILKVEDSGSNNHIALYFDTDTSITLSVNDDAATTTGTWDSSGSLSAGTDYDFHIEYTSTACTLKIEGTTRITVTPGGGIDFTNNLLTDVYFGSDENGESQADGVFAAA